MRHPPSTLHFSNRFTVPIVNDAIEWEEMPSLVARVRALGVLGTVASAAAPDSAWDATRPADLEPGVPPTPFREPVAGLSMREVVEPDVFRHFFGR